jgi:hypothetical protein
MYFMAQFEPVLLFIFSFSHGFKKMQGMVFDGQTLSQNHEFFLRCIVSIHQDGDLLTELRGETLLSLLDAHSVKKRGISLKLYQSSNHHQRLYQENNYQMSIFQFFSLSILQSH